MGLRVQLLDGLSAPWRKTDLCASVSLTAYPCFMNTRVRQRRGDNSCGSRPPPRPQEKSMGFNRSTAAAGSTGNPVRAEVEVALVVAGRRGIPPRGVRGRLAAPTASTTLPYPARRRISSGSETAWRTGSARRAARLSARSGPCGRPASSSPGRTGPRAVAPPARLTTAGPATRRRRRRGRAAPRRTGGSDERSGVYSARIWSLPSKRISPSAGYQDEPVGRDPPPASGGGGYRGRRLRDGCTWSS